MIYCKRLKNNYKYDINLLRDITISINCEFNYKNISGDIYGAIILFRLISKLINRN